MPNQVVWIVVVIGLALLAFLIGGGMLNLSKMQLSDLTSLFAGQKTELGSIKTIEDSCKAWLFGAEKYAAKAISEQYLVADKAGPFSTLTCCSQDLRNAVSATIKACATDSASAGCNGGNIADDDMEECRDACQAVLQIADSCRVQCAGASEAQLSKCLDSGVQGSSSICSGVIAAITCA